MKCEARMERGYSGLPELEPYRWRGTIRATLTYSSVGWCLCSAFWDRITDVPLALDEPDFRGLSFLWWCWGETRVGLEDLLESVGREVIAMFRMPALGLILSLRLSVYFAGDLSVWIWRMLVFSMWQTLKLTIRDKVTLCHLWHWNE